jgi:hypothetical protein
MPSYVFAVDAVGADEPVIAQSNCDEIEIFEQGQAGTANYTVREHSTAASAIEVPAGAKYTFKGDFRKGQTVGHVALASGSANFAQKESKVRQ